MYYSLPIEINNRRLHSCKLVEIKGYYERPDAVKELPEATQQQAEEQEAMEKQNTSSASLSSNEEVPYTFVIPFVPHEASTLFTIKNPRGKKILQCSRGYTKDERIDTSHFFVSYQTSGSAKQVLELHFTTSNTMPNLKQHIEQKAKEEAVGQVIVENRKLEDTASGLNIGRYAGNGYFEYRAEVVPSDKASRAIEIRIYFHSKTSRCYCYQFNLLAVEAKQGGYKLAIDFGSDASQAAYTRLSQLDGDSIQFVNLLKQLRKEKYYDDTTVSTQVLDQFDSLNSPNLLRSVFYIDSSKRMNEIPITTKPSLENPIRIFSYPNQKEISDTSNPIQQQYLKRLPNAKLAELSASSLLNLSIADSAFSEIELRRRVRRSLLNQLLHLCFNQLQEQQDKTNWNADNPIGIQLYLLVPNIYYQQQIYELIRDAYRDVQLIISSDPDFESLIGGVEILTISESDASFKGYIANALANDDQDFLYQGSTPNLRYLIVDAGKGTMDFSILESYGHSRKEYRSIYKSSIPASGEYLTFNCFATLADFYDLDVRQLILLYSKATESDKIILSDKLDQFKINNQIDLYGKEDYAEVIRRFASLNPNNLDNDLAQLSDSFKAALAEVLMMLKGKNNEQLSGKLNDTIKLLQGLLDLPERLVVPDHFLNLHLSLEQLTKEFEEHLLKAGIGNLEFHQVILTGRAFFYPPLKNAIINCLSKERTVNGNESMKQAWLQGDDKADKQGRILFEQRNAKAICLEGTLTNSCYINNNSDMAGALIRKWTGDYTRTQKISWWAADGFRSDNIPKPDKYQRIIEPFKLDEDFYYGTSINNDYIPRDGDEFFIGNFAYQLGEREDKKILREDIEQQTLLRIDVEQSGYIIRFPKDKDPIRLAFRKHGNKYDSFLLQSLFTTLAENFLDYLPHPTEERTSDTINKDERFQAQHPNEKHILNKQRNIDLLDDLVEESAPSPAEEIFDIFEETGFNTSPDTADATRHSNPVTEVPSFDDAFDEI